MAIRNEYVSSELAAGKLGGALDICAAQMYIGIAAFEIAAGDDDASIFRIFADVDANLIPVSLRVSADAITGLTDVDFGLYLAKGGAVVDKDILGDGLNLAAGFSRILALDALVTVDIANARKKLWELAGDTINTRKPAYDIVMTANTIGSGAGSVAVHAIFAQG